MDRLLGRAVDRATQSWSVRDTITYNLGLGLGARAVEDPALLRYVLEDGTISFPTMPAVLAVSGDIFYDDSFGIDFAGVLHGQESIEIVRQPPASGTYEGRTRVEGIWDLGPEKGAILSTVREVSEAGVGLVATCRSAFMLRRNGGFGGGKEGAPRAVELPQHAPDGAITMITRPEQALWYRLSGDTNPLHAVPEVARGAGFPRPILHGLCSYGVAAQAMVAACAEGDESRLRKLAVRFSAPVYPGEALRTEYWRVEGGHAFRVRVVERDVVALSGSCEWVGA